MSNLPLATMVRAAREQLGMTREQVALAAEISTSTLARLELSNRVPNARALARLAAVLNLPADTVLVAAGVGAA